MDLLVAETIDDDRPGGADEAKDAVAWYRNEGATTPRFGAAQVVDASFVGFKWNLVTRVTYATDLDADGDVDILVADMEYGSGSSGSGAIYW